MIWAIGEEAYYTHRFDFDREATDCPGFHTPAQARLERAAPRMLAALKKMREYGAGCYSGSAGWLDIVAEAIRAAEEGEL
jgi:hypothetical protein